MGHVIETGLAVLVLAGFWLIAAVIVAAGLHLFRRMDTMLSYGSGWRDAGVQMRAVRRKKDGVLSPVSHRAARSGPEPARRPAEPLPLPPTPQAVDGWSQRTLLIHHDKAPWRPAEMPPVLPEQPTMTLIPRPADSDG